jgi:hypothetical protein
MNSYVYGMNRVSQNTGTQMEYFLGDALGSVRDLTDTYTAETGLVFLRARYYRSGDGQYRTIGLRNLIIDSLNLKIAW